MMSRPWLLDWTESALIALFFAVSQDAKEDGELWAMYPDSLNDRAGVGHGLPLIDRNKVLLHLLHEPMWTGSRAKLAQRYELEKAPTHAVAFLPRRVFPRMVAQQYVYHSP